MTFLYASCVSRSGAAFTAFLMLLTVFAAAASPVQAQPVVAAEFAPSAEDMAAKAAKIEALRTGELAANENASALFAGSLTPAGIAQTRELLRLVNDRDAFADAERRLAAAGTDATPSLALLVAQARFLRLPQAEQDRLLDQHRAKTQAAATDAAASRARNQRIVELQAIQANLSGFLAGTPVDLSALALSLVDDDRALLDSDARAALAAQEAETPATDVSPDDVALSTLEADVSRLRARILSLSPGDYAALAAVQTAAESLRAEQIAAAEAEAAEAERAAQEAALQAENARTEVGRLSAAERQRLERARQQLAEFEAELARQTVKAEEVTELALRWRRQVREVKAEAGGPAREAAADDLYEALVISLQSVRSQLGQVLSRQSASGNVSAPAPLDAALPDDQPNYRVLLDLREALASQASTLRNRSETQLLEERTALYDAMIEMNQLRLELIDLVSPQQRSRIVGFGEDGAAQVSREINQIVLSARYTLVSLPQLLSSGLGPLTHPTPQIVVSLLLAGLAIPVLLVWRRAGGAVLARAEADALATRPRTLFSNLRASAFGFLGDVRGPLELLILLIVLPAILNGVASIPGDRLVWLAAFWIVTGWLLLECVNSLLRKRRQADPHSALRRRSLRLVATMLAGIGFTLALTAELVGVGAIHNWVVTACWLVVPPVLLLIANWWSGRIRELSTKGAARSGVLRAASTHTKGLIGQATLVMAAVHLMLGGAWAVISRRLKDVALIRELSEQRKRQRAEAQAAADAASGLYQPISDAELATLEPHRRPVEANPELRPAGPARQGLSLGDGRLVVVTGERGLGKSTFLDDALHGMDSGSVLRIRVEADGIEGIVRALSTACAESDGDIGESGALARAGVTTIVVDDVQRLIAPAIGGLAPLDRLIELSRLHQSRITWVLAIGELALAYISRARSGRVLFDAVHKLPRWGTKDLRDLIERRTMQAGIEPSFAGLRDLSIDSLASDESPEQRGRRMFFEELTAYSRGNPAIALEFWRRSLFRNTSTGEVEVRTFARPPLSVLSELPDPAVFVLRTLAQMEVADTATIQRCTDLSPLAVEDSIRRLLLLEVVHRHGDGYRLTLYWYPEVIRLLERQNLLATSLS